MHQLHPHARVSRLHHALVSQLYTSPRTVSLTSTTARLFLLLAQPAHHTKNRQMVQLTTTPRLLRAIRSYNTLCGAPPVLPVDAATTTTLSHTQVRMISEALLAHSACCCPEEEEEDYTFTALLRGSAVFHAPAPPPPQKSSEYVALMARLRREAEEREYGSLVGAPQTAAAVVPASEDDWRLVRSQVSMIFNVLLSVIATAAAVWKVAAAWDVAARLGVAFVAAIVVAVAEVALLWGYLSRIEEAGTRERAKGEVKETTGVSWIVGLGGVVEKRAGETGLDG